jgi:nitrogen-specific signal transduction histidine kinase
VSINKQQLQQVFLNILNSTIEDAGNKGGKILLTVYNAA